MMEKKEGRRKRSVTEKKEEGEEEDPEIWHDDEALAMSQGEAISSPQ